VSAKIQKKSMLQAFFKKKISALSGYFFDGLIISELFDS